MRPLWKIAIEISNNWNPVYFGAVPYLRAMSQLNLMTDNYGLDSADSIVAYFLSNAATWKGPVARRVKKELNGMLKK